MNLRPTRAASIVGSAALALTTLGLAGPAHADGSEISGPFTATDGSTSTYQAFDEGLTWEQARDAAAAKTDPTTGCAGHLVVITSQAEQDFVAATGLTHNAQWLGGYRDPLQEGQDGTDRTAGWHWVTGENFEFTSWADGEPNNANGAEDKMDFAYPSGTNWNDEADVPNGGYFVEYQCPASTTPPKVQRAVVSSVSPNTGSTSGGNTVTITGQHFTGTKRVLFGGKKAISYTVVSDTQITAVVPASSSKKAPRTVDVRVTTKGTSPKNPGDQYTYTNDTTNGE